MTIKEYMRKVESAKMTPKDSAGASFNDAMMETTEIWSNDACVGYFSPGGTDRRSGSGRH